MPLARAGETYGQALRAFGTVEDFELVFNRSFELQDGTPAFRTDIRYKFQASNPCTAVVISSFYAGKWVCIEAHTPGDPAEVAPIVESLTFAV
jgi:hypothetical protein